MNPNKDIINYFNRPSDHSRIIGRYSATDIYQIRRGELTPENFFDKKPVDQQGIKNIFRGIALEDGLKKLFEKLGYEQLRTGSDDQLKVEYDVLSGRIIPQEELSDPKYKSPEIVLVMKPDFVIKEKGEDKWCVWETKCPNKIKDEVPPWYQDQLECQYRLMGEDKNVYMCVINIQDNEYPLLCFVPYKPSKVRWSNDIEIIKEFHNKLKICLTKI